MALECNFFWTAPLREGVVIFLADICQQSQRSYNRVGIRLENPKVSRIRFQVVENVHLMRKVLSPVYIVYVNNAFNSQYLNINFLIIVSI